MSAPVAADPPTAGDHRLMRQARIRAHTRVKEIEKQRLSAMRMAFLEEIGAIVRSASPFLLALLELEGLTLDEVVKLIEPQHSWPRRPHLLRRSSSRLSSHPSALRQYLAPLLPRELSVPPRHGHVIEMAGEAWLRIEVVDHSLEVNAQIGPVIFTTRFGELRVEHGEEMSEALFLGCVGRLIEEVIDYVALRGRGWRIIAVEDPELDVGQVLVVATGSVEYRMPWAG